MVPGSNGAGNNAREFTFGGLRPVLADVAGRPSRNSSTVCAFDTPSVAINHSTGPPPSPQDEHAHTFEVGDTASPSASSHNGHAPTRSPALPVASTTARASARRCTDTSTAIRASSPSSAFRAIQAPPQEKSWNVRFDTSNVSFLAH